MSHDSSNSNQSNFNGIFVKTQIKWKACHGGKASNQETTTVQHCSAGVTLFMTDLLIYDAGGPLGSFKAGTKSVNTHLVARMAFCPHEALHHETSRFPPAPPL